MSEIPGFQSSYQVFGFQHPLLMDDPLDDLSWPSSIYFSGRVPWQKVLTPSFRNHEEIRQLGQTGGQVIHGELPANTNHFMVNKSEDIRYITSCWLPPHWKNIRQTGSFPHVGVNMKNVWNHRSLDNVVIILTIGVYHPNLLLDTLKVTVSSGSCKK